MRSKGHIGGPTPVMSCSGSGSVLMVDGHFLCYEMSRIGSHSDAELEEAPGFFLDDTAG